jgi:hypothetical protein
VIVLRHRHHLFGDAYQNVLLGFDRVIIREIHLGGGKDQQRAEDIDDPVERVNQRRSERDHDAAHDQGAQNAPIEHAMLEVFRDSEISEHDREHEHVVDAERFLDEVRHEEFQRGCLAIERVRLVEPDSTPMVRIREVDEDVEHEREADPEGGPSEGCAQRDVLPLLVQDHEVERQKRKYEGDESRPSRKSFKIPF